MKDKKIIIVALIMAVISLSVGFAAFSSTLTISSSATVTPNSSDFKVIFSSSETSAATTAITPSKSSGVTASNATVTGTKLSNISVGFTEPGQSATYNFYVRNDGQYDAYLNNLNIGAITCTPGSGATKALVDAACEGISIEVVYGHSGTGTDTSGQIVAGMGKTSQTNLTNHKLQAGKYVGAIFYVRYESGSARADGPFTVTIGDTTFDFSTVD